MEEAPGAVPAVVQYRLRSDGPIIDETLSSETGLDHLVTRLQAVGGATMVLAAPEAAAERFDRAGIRFEADI